MSYEFKKRGPLYVPEHGPVRRYSPDDLTRYKRYRRRHEYNPLLAITPDATTSNTGASPGTTFSFNHTVSGADTFLVVSILWYSTGSTVSGINFNSVAMTLIGEQDGTDGFAQFLGASMWGLIAPASGTHSVDVSMDNNPGGAVWAASSWNGVHQTVPTGTMAKASGDGANPTVNVSSASGEVVVDCFAGYSPTASVGSGQTQLFTQNAAVGIQGAGSYEAGAGTVTMDWAGLVGGFSNNWRIVAVPLKPSAAAGRTD